ncbi:DUF3592 domain-containing protein [Luteolibacter pohnpeiensis]|uniref:DUF3592 domain-containing protein n=1 Tax=Luteolibacter pohnpeiensis TaxID=454153 RepID=A0A934VVI6_9BACT|nr:DUF3592 domain-containing protein [Luteolibacter pohnpeiensis]MBK1883597.1 DUF3592 domain-containing protein [Luteolibacter pohnpeiensis]
MTDSSAHRSTAGRWFLSVLGLFLAFIGGIFFWLMLRSYERASAMDHWPETACVVLDSNIQQRQIDPNSPPEYQLSVLFGYSWKGVSRTSEHLTLRDNPWRASRETLEEDLTKYEPGTKLICHVNPENPDQAIIKPDSKAAGYSLWFPSLFIIAGLGITIMAILPKRPIVQPV